MYRMSRIVPIDLFLKKIQNLSKFRKYKKNYKMYVLK